MTMPSFTIRQLLESGVHFGHHTRRWNPKMTPYIFGVRNNIHIINLEETVPLLSQALSAIREVAASGGRILFVGTKKSCSEIIAESAKSCGQYYVNHRWLGGMMTNFSTVSNSIKRLKELDEKLDSEDINALSIFSEYVKAKNYDAAFEPWMELRERSPKFNSAIYVYGERILKHKIKNSGC